MGLGPISAAVGVASAVSGMAQGAQQRKIAEASAQANQKAAEASAALRQIQINSSRDYADYNARLNSLTRQFQYMQASMGNNAQGILDQMNYNSQKGQLDMAYVGNQMGLVDASLGAAKQRTGAEQQAHQQNIEAAGQSTSNQNQLTNAAQGTAEGMRQGDARRAMLQTMMAASGGAPGNTENTLQMSDLNNTIAASLAQSLQQQGISEQDISQLIYTKDIAEIARQLGVNAADYMEQTAYRNAQMTNTAIDAKSKDLTLEAQLANQGRGTSMKMLDFAQASDTNTDQINRIFSEYGFQQQANASNIQLQSQLASLNASRAQSQASAPGIFDYLGMGLKAYSSLSGAGIFGGNGASSNKNPLSSGGYSIFSGGYGLNSFSGSVNDPTNYSASGASFTQLPL